MKAVRSTKPVTKVFRSKAERETRLTQLGVSEGDLRSAASFGDSEAYRCNEFDPRTARGWIRWAKTVRALRQSLVKKGWERRESRGLPTVVSPDGKHAISVSSADENTGLEFNSTNGSEVSPATNRPKGQATKLVVDRNQLSFADFDETFPPKPKERREPDQTWYLLFHEDRESGELRLELSLPVNMDADGRVSEWSERIILDSLGTLADPVAVAEDEAPIDVPVQRRST